MTEVNYSTFDAFLAENFERHEVIKTQYVELLSQLTSAPDISVELFRSNIEQIHKMGSIVIATVGSFETSDLKIVGSGTVVVEPKIIRGGRNVGHIEDIVVSKDHRGLGIAKIILEKLKAFSSANNCYKVILDCDEAVQVVYEKSGFAVKGLQMGIYL
jgi:glucosamine-phosphate N-acetyltransferase